MLNKTWKKIVFIIALLMLIAGLALVLFAPVSNYIGKQIADSEINAFNDRKQSIEDGTYDSDENGYIDLDALLKDSIAYNNNLKKNQYSLLVDDYSYTKPSLNLADYGITDSIYGYVSAPTIDMNLPIYLGANSSTMSYGAAHLTYTSLPIGGNSTNTVLAGHTGYVGRIFFDNIRNLQIGDTVSVTNYWETLEYEVIRTEIHSPSDSASIYITKGEDLLTLLTCINGGSDRYYVICKANNN